MRSDALKRHTRGAVSYLHNDVTAGTPVVFLHGFSDMADCWNALIDRLDIDLPLYALDAPAHGSSPYDGGPYVPQLVERAIDFIAALERPCILVGHSMGALEAMYIAGDAPNLVRAAVLEDPPMAQDLSEWLPENITQPLLESLEALRALGVDGLLERIRSSSRHWDAAELLPWVHSKMLVDLSLRDQFVIHREPMTDTLDAIACPTLLIIGDPALGGIVTEETASWAQTRCPHLSVAHFPGAGHSVHRDAAASVAAAVREFILEQA